MSRHFDALVPAAAQAGIPLAGRLSNAGQTVALVERDLLGGTCVNTGCTPTKAMVASAYAARMAARAAEYGVRLEGTPTVDLAAVVARKDAVVQHSRDGLDSWIGGLKNCTLLRGTARFTAPKTLEVNGETITADKVFLNVGGRANVPEMPGVKEVPFLTNSSLLQLQELPEHLVVVGGGYIGLEFAQMFRRFGSRVTVVEMGKRLLSHEDEDFATAIQKILEDEGVMFRMKSECIAFGREKGCAAGACQLR